MLDYKSLFEGHTPLPPPNEKPNFVSWGSLGTAPALPVRPKRPGEYHVSTARDFTSHLDRISCSKRSTSYCCQAARFRSFGPSQVWTEPSSGTETTAFQTALSGRSLTRLHASQSWISMRNLSPFAMVDSRDSTTTWQILPYGTVIIIPRAPGCPSLRVDSCFEQVKSSTSAGDPDPTPAMGYPWLFDTHRLSQGLESSHLGKSRPSRAV